MSPPAVLEDGTLPRFSRPGTPRLPGSRPGTPIAVRSGTPQMHRSASSSDHLFAAPTVVGIAPEARHHEGRVFLVAAVVGILFVEPRPRHLVGDCFDHVLVT